jgi:uncharacterized membrane protein YidH (DUF202 family)
MKPLIGIFMLLGAFTASSVHDSRSLISSDNWMLTAFTLLMFALALWNWFRLKRKVAEKILRNGVHHAWLALTVGMYVLGFAVMWHLEGKY